MTEELLFDIEEYGIVYYELILDAIWYFLFGTFYLYFQTGNAMRTRQRSDENRMTGDQSIKQIGARVLWVLFFLFTAATAILFFGARYLLDNWSDLSMDELVYHMKTTIKGTNPAMIRDAILRYGLPAALVIAAVAGTIVFFRGKKKARRIAAVCIFCVELCVLFDVKNELDRKVGFSDYIRMYFDLNGGDFIGEHYVDPRDVELKFPEKKRNLIYIFIESGEITYADPENGGAFEQNIIPELTALAQENEDFSGNDKILNGGIALPGTTWTVGAMFAQSTGIPLKVPINGNAFYNEDKFFSSTVAIGDILKEQGYHNELLIGSDAVFGGRDLFYRTHGAYDIRDYTYALENGRVPEGYSVFWGYEDEKLFQFAKEDLREMADSGEPFNLTMLTVDTHFEDGYRCRLCRDDFGEQYADAFACSSRQLTGFVRWVQEQDFYENTTIILAGDHLTMDKDFCNDVPDDYRRKTYVCVINPGDSASKADLSKWREYDTFDLFPTTLAALNVKIPGDRLALGTNLYSEKKTLIEEFGLEECIMQLTRPSAFMDELSGLTISEKELERSEKNMELETETYDDGTICLAFSGFSGTFSESSIKKVEAEITDRETGETAVYEAELVRPLEIDENKFHYEVYIEPDDPFFEGKTLDDFVITVYASIGDFEHHKMAEYGNDSE